MPNNNIYNDYNLMNDEEKYAMRYGASGKSLADVVRYSPNKLANPNKVFDAWVKGEDMRKAGQSKNFLDELEKEEMAALEKTGTSSVAKPKALQAHNNYPLQTNKNSDIIKAEYASNYTGNTKQNSSGSAVKNTTHVTYGYPDVNVVGGIQHRLNEMGFLDDYSVSRKGKNATTWHVPESPPFNMEAYNRKREKQKREKEAAKKEKRKSSNSLLANILAEFVFAHGGTQPFSPEANIIYDEYQKNIENDLQDLAKSHGQQIIKNYMDGTKSQNP